MSFGMVPSHKKMRGINNFDNSTMTILPGETSYLFMLPVRCRSCIKSSSGFGSEDLSLTMVRLICFGLTGLWGNLSHVCE